MKPKKPIRGKKSYGRRNILGKKPKTTKSKPYNENLNKGQKNAKFVQRGRQMQDEMRKQKRIEDKYRAETTASMLDTYMERDELIQEVLLDTARDKTYDELLVALNSGKPNKSQSIAQSDSESADEEDDDSMQEEENEEETRLDALFSSEDEENEAPKLAHNNENLDFVDNVQIEDDLENDSDLSEGENEDNNENAKCKSVDNFAKHVDYELKPEQLENLLALSVQQKKYTYVWPQLCKIDIEMPLCDMKNPENIVKVLPEIPTNQLKLNDIGVNASLIANINSPLTKLENELLSIVNNYFDVYYPKRTHEDAPLIRQIYCLHALNHLKKTRSRVLRHNAKLMAAAKEAEKTKKRKKKAKLEVNNKPKIEVGIVPDSYRDQGFVRPKVLIMLPTRDAAFQVVNKLATLCFGESVVKCGQINSKLLNYERYV